jgi:hypothetical protein
MVDKLMKPLQACFWKDWLIRLLFLALAACTPSNTADKATVTRQVATVAATAVSPTLSASPTPQPTPEMEPTLAPTATVSRTPIASRTPVPTLVPARLISVEPIFTGGDLQFWGWSPNGRYLAYFEYTEEQVATAPVEGLRGTYSGTFVIYDSQTGEKCTDYPLNGLFPYEGPGRGPQWRWLPDGRLLINLPDGQLLLTEAPCVPGENIASQLDGSILSFGPYSPDKNWLILSGGQQYWLYHWSTGEAHAIVDVQPDNFNNLIWSPDSQHISITLAGNYTGQRSPIGGTRVVEVATGETIARYDWEPANALDGTFGGPVWISNDEFVVTLSLDQGPFFMNINGEVRPLLPLFNQTFDPDNYWPPVDVYAEIENGRYAILLGNELQESEAKLYTFTPEGESVEMFEETSLSFRLFDNGEVVYEDNGSYWTRPTFEPTAPFIEQPVTYKPWLPANNNDSRVLIANDSTSIFVYDGESNELIERLQVEGYESGHALQPILSPDAQWLAIFINDLNGFGKALFVVPVPSN